MSTCLFSPRRILILVLFLAGHTLAMADVLPSGGFGATLYGVGTILPIRWTNDLETESVDVLLWNGALHEWTEIARNVPADQGTYNWQIPPTIVPGNRYRIGVRDAARPIRTMLSASWLSIGLPAPLVTTVSAEIDAGADVLLSPLPATDQVTVTWSDRDVERLEVVDLARRTLATWDVVKGAGTTQLDLRDLPSGSHFLRIIAADGRLVVKPLPVIR